MKLYIWRHNRKFHSYSMIEEPCVHLDFYTLATAVVWANSIEEALTLLDKQQAGWRIDDLRKITPEIVECSQAGVIFQSIQGS